MVVFLAPTSPQPFSDLSIYPHQGQNKCVFYSDGSLEQNRHSRTWPVLSMPRRSLGSCSTKPQDTSHCASLCETPDLWPKPSKQTSVIEAPYTHVNQ